MRRIESRSPAAPRLALAVCLAAVSLRAGDAPPDLRLRWKDPAPPVHGRTGATVELAYEVTNVGGSAAFAVIVKAQSTVGPVGTAVRIQPGPAAGAAIQRRLSFALVRGMREICVDAVLQPRGGDDPPDPNMQNNRICRSIAIEPQSNSEEVSR